MSPSTRKVTAFVDNLGRIRFNCGGDLEMGGTSIINVIDLSGVQSITNILTHITMISAPTYYLQVGDVSNIRDLFGWGDAETGGTISTPTVVVDDANSDVEGLTSENIRIIPVSDSYNVISGTPTIPAGHHVWESLDAEWDIYAYDTILSGTGDYKSTTGDLTIYPETAAYDILGGTGSFLVDLILSADLDALSGDINTGDYFRVGDAGFLRDNDTDSELRLRSTKANFDLHLMCWDGNLVLYNEGNDDNLQLRGGFSGGTWVEGILRPMSTYDLGTSTDYFAAFHYQTLSQHSGFWEFEKEHECLDVLKRRRVLRDETGSVVYEKLDGKETPKEDYGNLPEWLLIDTELPKRHWGLNLGALVGTACTVIVQLSEKLDAAIEELNHLKEQIGVLNA